MPTSCPACGQPAASVAPDGSCPACATELLLAIQRPNVVRVLAARELGRHPAMVCEYLPGGTLRERLRAEGRLPFAQAACVIDDVLAGLEACHSRGIVPRDLKPENVLFDASGNAKVADLGLAKHYGAEGPTLTGAGQLIGTPRYMSPEQVKGEPVVVASDLYAAGMLLYEMLAGHAPFDGSSLFEIMRRQAEDEPPPLPPDVEAPPGVLRVMERALAKRPQERPPSAQDMAQALRAASRPSGRTRLRPPTRPTRKQAGAREPRRRGFRAVVLAASLLALAVLCVVLTRTDATPHDAQAIVEGGELRGLPIDRVTRVLRGVGLREINLSMVR